MKREVGEYDETSAEDGEDARGAHCDLYSQDEVRLVGGIPCFVRSAVRQFALELSHDLVVQP